MADRCLAEIDHHLVTRGDVVVGRNRVGEDRDGRHQEAGDGARQGAPHHSSMHVSKPRLRAQEGADFADRPGGGPHVDGRMGGQRCPRTTPIGTSASDLR
jgi:hypothetical protein